jgi:hypothetical protein
LRRYSMAARLLNAYMAGLLRRWAAQSRKRRAVAAAVAAVGAAAVVEAATEAAAEAAAVSAAERQCRAAARMAARLIKARRCRLTLSDPR